MKKETLLVAVIVLIVGLLIGYMVALKSSAPSQSAAPVQGTATAPVVNSQKKIDEIKSLLAADPANRNAWVALGNEYFDSNQFIDAIDAYDNALKLNPEDPNVLTDQGVMFRKMGWFDRAIENFTKAAALDPKHVSSFYNLGVVYRQDLHDFPKAIDAWTRFLELNPSGPAAEQIRQQIEWMKTHPPVKQEQ